MTGRLKAPKGLIFLCAFVLLALGFSGCKRAAYPNCSKNADCLVSVDGQEATGVCYMGKCEECIEDADCAGLKQCVDNRCEASCQANADCTDGSHCENAVCVQNCLSDASCRDGEACSQGRCMASTDAGDMELAAQGAECVEAMKVYFDFDKYEIKREDQSVLNTLAICLNKNPEEKVHVAGNTDERGTPGYNLLLGEHRAKAVTKFLNQKGVAADRMTTVSFGAEKPLEVGKNESAWSKNRRSEISVQRPE